MSRLFFAQAALTVPWNYFPPWLFGLFGALCLGLVVLMFIYYCKKIFGRRPPFEDVLEAQEKKLRNEIYHAKNSVRKELGSRIETLEENFREMQLDRQRKWTELQKEYHTLELTMARMLGAFDEMKKTIQSKI